MPATIHKVTREVPTCLLREDIAKVRSRISDDWHLAVVIDEDRIVLGVLDLKAAQDTSGSIEDLMKPAPLTLRPSVLLIEAAAYFEKSDRTFALVTKSTGELMGAIRKPDVEHRHGPGQGSISPNVPKNPYPLG